MRGNMIEAADRFMTAATQTYTATFDISKFQHPEAALDEARRARVQLREMLALQSRSVKRFSRALQHKSPGRDRGLSYPDSQLTGGGVPSVLAASH